ncbi:DUF1330 domain-containing protein [Pectobacterium polaris]|uniref:DUF1330 domain-containing protein n=1 Tax=Pectobacterium polaris TaxID=2042057 RepID=UPI0032ED1E33
MKGNSKAYFIFDVKINNIEALTLYQEKVVESYTRYGGILKILGGRMETIEGDPPQGVIVMLEFDCVENAHNWYNSFEYQEIIPYRHAAAETNAWLVENIPE